MSTSDVRTNLPPFPVILTAQLKEALEQAEFFKKQFGPDEDNEEEIGNCEAIDLRIIGPITRAIAALEIIRQNTHTQRANADRTITILNGETR